MKSKKYMYLYRLVLIIFLVLFVPAILFLNFFWNSSYKEIENRHQIYLENLMSSFADNFLIKLAELKQHALDFTISSKDYKSIFWKGSENFFENEYWYSEAVEEIEAYRVAYVEYFGVYYYENDRVITKGGTQTAKQYIEATLSVKNPNMEIWSFFDLQSYKSGEVLFSTTNTDSRSDGVMLIGYCTELGKNHDPVLIFYVIDSNDYKDVLDVAYSNSGIHFYVSDAETNKIYLALGEAANNPLSLLGEGEESAGKEQQKSLYLRNVEYLPVSFIMHITEDSYQNSIVSFYQQMKNVLWVTTVIFLIICLSILYIIYMPVYKLVAGLEYQGGDEFEAIQSMLDDRNAKILEQEMLIIDLLLKHLISGISISAKRISQLGISAEYKYYCVFIMEKDTLLTKDIEQLTREMDSNFGIRLFVTDWEEATQNILIMFMKNPQIDGVEIWLRGWVEEHCLESDKLYPGKVVNELNDIRLSLLSCMEKERPKARQRKNSKDDIVRYLEEHYRDKDLSLTQVADHFQISHYTLSRMFKNQVGVGFTEYINSKRIEDAKELLLTTSHSVRDIGVMVGFINDNYFSRIFKTMVGVTPMSFREGN